jgi:hypothetical protein
MHVLSKSKSTCICDLNDCVYSIFSGGRSFSKPIISTQLVIDPHFWHNDYEVNVKYHSQFFWWKFVYTWIMIGHIKKKSSI